MDLSGYTTFSHLQELFNLLCRKQTYRPLYGFLRKQEHQDGVQNSSYVVIHMMDKDHYMLSKEFWGTLLSSGWLDAMENETEVLFLFIAMQQITTQFALLCQNPRVISKQAVSSRLCFGTMATLRCVNINFWNSSASGNFQICCSASDEKFFYLYAFACNFTSLIFTWFKKRFKKMIDFQI